MAPIPPFSASEIAEKARRDLLLLLEGIRGKKNLVLEKALTGSLNLLVKFSTLQEYGVDRLFFLENDNVDSSQRNVVFLVRGEKAKTVMAVAEQIKRIRRDSQIEHEFSIFWVPRRTMVSDQLLESAGVLGEASVSEWPLFFVPLADDVLSLELEDAVKDIYLRKDPTSIYLSAKALMLQQQKYGLFPRIIGKGDNAKRLANLLIRMRTEVTAGESTNSGPSFLGLTPSSTIDSLVIIDREVDFPTVLLTQLTYEGLIDEVFNITANQAEVDSSVVGGAAPQPGQTGSASTSMKRKVLIDPKDSLYTTLGDSNFAIVGNLLNKAARRLQSSTERNQLAAKTTAELRDFVAKLPGYQAEQASLKIHTSLAEEIIKHTHTDIFTRSLEVQQNIMSGADPTTQHDTITELISRDIPLPTILRLLCLESTTNAGIRPKDLETFKRAIIQAYGPQHLLTLSSLEKMNLLQPRGGSSLGAMPAAKPGSVTNYTPLRKSLRLWDDEVNEADPNDISYVFSGYAPLSVRIVQSIIQKQTLANLIKPSSNPQASAQANPLAQGLRIFDDASKYVRGATFDETQTGEEKAVKARSMLNGNHSDGAKTVVVFFLGGVTRAEISALRFVGRKLRDVGGEGRGSRIVICSTGIVRGEGLIGCAVESGRFEG
ncbi:Sec1-like protein [Melanomma pulvis-pyrius CBS 109.77]|uniref:Sec1-like protein n=1 Tax=Melanomma pulvis-pyrius CBS 109.77 TaxID=1314802 RepID=A0A6A6X494_9PLEO|nr:Sec1-like protein [Melanomma pulvis-pyrius CBS 109.77]